MFGIMNSLLFMLLYLRQRAGRCSIFDTSHHDEDVLKLGKIMRGLSHALFVGHVLFFLKDFFFIENDNNILNSHILLGRAITPNH